MAGSHKVNHRVGLHDLPLKTFVTPKQHAANKRQYMKNKGAMKVAKKKWWNRISAADKEFYKKRSAYLSLLKNGHPLPKAEYLGVVHKVSGERKDELAKMTAKGIVTKQQRKSLSETYKSQRKEQLGQLRSKYMAHHPSRMSKSQTEKFEKHLAKVGTKRISAKDRTMALHSAMDYTP